MLVKNPNIESLPLTAISNRSIPDCLSESESLAHAGNFSQAAQVLEGAVAEEPLSSAIIAGDPDESPTQGYALLLQLAAKSGNKELALEYYRRMIKLNPQMPENAKKAAMKAGIL